MSLDVLNLEGYISGLKITPRYNTRVSRTNTGYIDISDFGGGIYDLEVKLDMRDRATMEPIYAFLCEMRGSGARFKVNLGKKSRTRSGYTTPLYVHTAGQEGDTVIVNGGSDGDEVLKKGDFLTFEGQDKLYIATQDAIFGGAGTTEIKISPSLYTSPNLGAQVITNNVLVTVVLDPDAEIDWELDEYLWSGTNLSLWEAFRS